MQVKQFETEETAREFIAQRGIDGVPEYDTLFLVWNIALPNGMLYEE